MKFRNSSMQFESQISVLKMKADSSSVPSRTAFADISAKKIIGDFSSNRLKNQLEIKIESDKPNRDENITSQTSLSLRDKTNDLSTTKKRKTNLQPARKPTPNDLKSKPLSVEKLISANSSLRKKSDSSDSAFDSFIDGGWNN